MSLDADLIVDRRRLRRKLLLWRVVGILAIVLCVATAFFVFAGGKDYIANRRAHIARITVTGLITDNRNQLKLIEQLAKADAVKAVIVAINSPGGTTAGGEALYGALRALSAKKPVVAQIGTVGASAGYMVALATDHIVARRSTLTGSIGVIMQFGEVSGLLKTLGVTVEEVKSSPLKAEPTFHKPASPETRAMLEGLVTDSYDWFVGLVAERRGFDKDTAHRLADGRVFTGAQALEARLIDEIGGEGEAVSWLTREKGVAAGLPVRDWKPRDSGGQPFSLAQAFARGTIEAFGAEIRRLGNDAGAIVRGNVAVDGLVSVWQAAPTGSLRQGEGEPDD